MSKQLEEVNDVLRALATKITPHSHVSLYEAYAKLLGLKLELLRGEK